MKDLQIATAQAFVKLAQITIDSDEVRVNQFDMVRQSKEFTTGYHLKHSLPTGIQQVTLDITFVKGGVFEAALAELFKTHGL